MKKQDGNRLASWESIEASTAALPIIGFRHGQAFKQ